VEVAGAENGVGVGVATGIPGCSSNGGR